MKNEKGITLIALIITIIVMLILVGVTINVALNGGIFDRAKDAKQKTSREVSREQIVAAMIGAYDNNGNFVKANAKLPEETKWCSKDENYSNASGEGNYVVTKNNEKFYVSPTDGTVLDEEPISNIEYYTKIMNGLGEMVYVVNYSEQSITIYGGQEGETLSYWGTLPVEFVRDTFNVYIEDVGINSRTAEVTRSNRNNV